MILPAEGPLSPFGWPLRALYVALNSPVVTLESFSTGPATAAVALHEEGASLCVRSARSGQICWFVTADDLRSDTRVAVDAALSFAESMGFLFDEDEVARRGDAGPAEAVALWLDVCGEEAQSDVLPEGFGLGLEDSKDLDERMEILLTDPAQRVPDSPRADLAPAGVLTKFRRPPADAPAGSEASGPPVDLRLRLMSRF